MAQRRAPTARLRGVRGDHLHPELVHGAPELGAVVAIDPRLRGGRLCARTPPTAEPPPPASAAGTANLRKLPRTSSVGSPVALGSGS